MLKNYESDTKYLIDNTDVSSVGFGRSPAKRTIISNDQYSKLSIKIFKELNPKKKKERKRLNASNITTMQMNKPQAGMIQISFANRRAPFVKHASNITTMHGTRLFSQSFP